MMSRSLIFTVSFCLSNFRLSLSLVLLACYISSKTDSLLSFIGFVIVFLLNQTLYQKSPTMESSKVVSKAMQTAFTVTNKGAV